MELSKAVSSIAIVLAVVLTAGYALGEEDLAESQAQASAAVQK